MLALSACSNGSDSKGNTQGSGGALASGGASQSGGAASGGAAGATTTNTGGNAAGGSAGASSSGGSGGVVEGGGTAGTAGDAATGGAKPTTCPAQTATEVVAAGTAPQQAAGAAVAATATRPQLSQAEADAQYTMLEAFKNGGDITLQIAAGGSSGGTDAGGASSGGAAGSATGGAASGGAASGGASSGGTSAGGAPTGGATSSGGAAVGGRAPVVFGKTDNWDPLSNGIGDVSKIVPTFTVAADGSGTHTKLQAAIDEAVFLAQCPRAYIRLVAGTYRETVRIPSKTSAPPITIYSTESDASKTVIVKNYSASGSPTGEVIAPGPSGSATFTQNSLAGFQAKNITIANDYEEGTVAGDDQSAVALLNQGDKSQFENVRILGNRYSLYIKSTATNFISRSYFRDSYIEGDDSFIAGRGTAVFDHCEIHSIGARVATGGIIAAPSTALNNPHGFLFISSNFTADASASGVFLGKQWFESMGRENVGKVVVRNSTLGAHLNKAAPWTYDTGRTTPKDPTATTPIILYTSDDYFATEQAWKPREPFLAEYGNSGPGAAP
ncbi:MAG: pectinesterase family protein [Polyangiaceae bacterium]